VLLIECVELHGTRDRGLFGAPKQAKLLFASVRVRDAALHFVALGVMVHALEAGG